MKALLPIYVKAQCWFAKVKEEERGATMVEYALMVALIAAVCIGAVTAIGTGTNNTFTTVGAALP